MEWGVDQQMIPLVGGATELGEDFSRPCRPCGQGILICASDQLLLYLLVVHPEEGSTRPMSNTFCWNMLPQGLCAGCRAASRHASRLGRSWRAHSCAALASSGRCSWRRWAWCAALCCFIVPSWHDDDAAPPQPGGMQGIRRSGWWRSRRGCWADQGPAS